jgi:chromosome segregation ATPase
VEFQQTPSQVLDASAGDVPGLQDDSKTPEEYRQIVQQMQADYETSELRRQEETHDYLERIDALQSKLQYLTKEAAAIAKTALSQVSPGTVEHNLAAKDEKIALLLEEGQKLSQTELKHMSIIKKLRAKATEDERKLTETTRALEKQEKLARDLRERVKQAETAERRATEKGKVVLQLEKELDSVRRDRDAKAALAQDLQTQLSDATLLAREDEAKAQAEALAWERKVGGALKEELLQLKSEREASERQHQSELRSLRDHLERTKERLRLAEIEREGEQSVSRQVRWHDHDRAR